MSKNIQHPPAIMRYELVIRGLPGVNNQMVGILLSRQDMDHLLRSGRLIVNALPPQEPPKMDPALLCDPEVVKMRDELAKLRAEKLKTMQIDDKSVRNDDILHSQ